MPGREQRLLADAVRGAIRETDRALTRRGLLDDGQVFGRVLGEQARAHANQGRHLQLPAFPEGPPIKALRAWLDALENFTAVPRLLICIDEFERLASLSPGHGQDLRQFMALLRATILRRRRVLDESGELLVPVFGRWLREHEGAS